ncbi:flagellar biosynthesis anti-sigma factor FlgM [Brockia lithotrophica]|uniref:Anti-sigma-28 factor FlgM n=1 Tax=Brockia lithotrophica TaxID=933949 RepID=A0A660KXH0_9BACL|nr:flagellar biosynthesis anti-sigma factor FlgM [Brockia lithotrophica]RKQ85490.1 anti-sigma-28 factor FlgM [Brockia lithotrophica]
MRIERPDPLREPHLPEIRPVGTGDTRVPPEKSGRGHLSGGTGRTSFDRLELSEAAEALFRRGEGAVSGAQGETRIEALRRALREGTYRVPAHRVADAILAYLEASRAKVRDVREGGGDGRGGEERRV